MAAGQDLNSVEEYSGNSDIRVTIDTYARAMPARHREAADRIGEWLDEGSVCDKCATKIAD